MCWHWLMNPIIRCKALWLAPALSTKTSGATLKKLSAIPSSKEFARILHTQPDELGQGATFRQNVRDLSQYGLSFETLDASPWVPEVSNHREYLMPLEWEIHIWPNRPSFTSRVSFSRQLWPSGRQDNGLGSCAEGTRIEVRWPNGRTEVFPGNSGEQS
jgi:hypothetical protein